jgi:tRNA pseudouridine13 synthase
MKLKSIPEDFIVDELTSFAPDSAGRLFVYELEKRSLATMEALSIIARRNGMRVKELSAAGLKDKHGLTRQIFSATRPLKEDTGDERIALRFVGKCAAPLTAAVISGNRFRVVMRNLRAEEAQALPRNGDELLRFGVPNYYDNQRFGGIAHGQGFIGKALALGDYEEALRLHLAAPHRKQSLTDKQNRRLAAKYWGDWETLHRRMKRSPERALVEYLRDNLGAWAECFDRIPPTLRTMFVAAYQSFLFNQALTRMIQDGAKECSVVRYKAGEIAFHRSLPADLLAQWRDLKLPLPGGSTKLEDYPHAAEHVRAVLEEEGVTLEQLRLPGLQRTRFKAAERAMLVFPQEFALKGPEPDERNQSREKATASFTLPRGSFATIITRRLALQY